MNEHRHTPNPEGAVSLTRRRWLGGSVAALALDGCSASRTEKWSPVSIHRTQTYSEDLYDLVRRVIEEHELKVRGKRVLLKPNLVEFDDRTVINTNPKLVHATLEAFRAAGAADVRVAEGPGHRRVTFDLADAAGYFSTIPRFESIFTDLNLDEITRVELLRPRSRLKSLYLPNTVLGCDLLVQIETVRSGKAPTNFEHICRFRRKKSAAPGQVCRAFAQQLHLTYERAV